ncbi:MAG: energy transducer TonB, partial [Proteobacteria bacterium]
TMQRAEDVAASYGESIRRAIERHKHYPRAARLRRIQGLVTVAFTVAADGSISGLRAVGGAPSPLEQAALDAVRAVGKFASIPRETGKTSLEFRIPMAFSLD